MFHSFAIPPSQCASAGLAEQSTNALLVAWPAHNLLIAWPASPHRRFYSVVSQSITFSPVFYVWVCTCFSLHLYSHVYSCFHSLTVFPSKHAPTWLSRAIHQHSFSRLAGTPFTDCMNCLIPQTFLFCFFKHYCILASSSEFCLHMFEFIFVFTCLFWCFH